MRQNSPLFLLLFLCFSLIISCTEDKTPEPEETYLFPYKSEIDAKYLKCGYENYESCSDLVKKWMRGVIPYLSTQELIELGEEFHKKYIPFSIANHERADWVEEIVNNMKPHMVENEFPYNTYVVSSSIFNAFTIPGGNIYVTTGLLGAVENKDELSYIIGHEMGHNENDHTKELARLYKYVEKQKREGGVIDYIQAFVAKILSEICDKSDELECDISAMYLVHQAGYSPDKALGGIRLLRQFSTPKPDSDWEAFLLSFFSSHPWSEDRDNCVTPYVKKAKVTAACDQIFKNGTIGKVTTKRDPLNIREYPIMRANKIAKIPKNAEVEVICDCVPQKYRKDRDWLFVEYKKDRRNAIRGWVDKKYVKFRDPNKRRKRRER